MKLTNRGRVDPAADHLGLDRKSPASPLDADMSVIPAPIYRLSNNPGCDGRRCSLLKGPVPFPDCPRHEHTMLFRQRPNRQSVDQNASYARPGSPNVRFRDFQKDGKRFCHKGFLEWALQGSNL